MVVGTVNNSFAGGSVEGCEVEDNVMTVEEGVDVETVVITVAVPVIPPDGLCVVDGDAGGGTDGNVGLLLTVTKPFIVEGKSDDEV